MDSFVNYSMKKLTDEIRSVYLAGIVDGEGCITLTRREYPKELDRSPVIRIRVSVKNTSPHLILRLLEWWPESRYYRVPKRPNRKLSWYWKPRTQSSSVRLIKTILPYLCVKDLQARLVLAYYQRLKKVKRFGGPGNHTSSEELEARDRFVEIMHKLNLRGVSSTRDKRRSDALP